MKASELTTLAEGRTTQHTAIFTMDQLPIAYKLLYLVRSSKGTTVSFEGLELNPFYTSLTMECYLKSRMADDQKTYCSPGADSVQNENPLIEERLREDEAISSKPVGSPCKRLVIDPSDKDAAPSADQLQATALSQGIWWCPNFKLNMADLRETNRHHQFQ